MGSCRPPLFWKRKFEPHVIVTCVRWYCRFCLSLRDLEELMAERGLAVDHTTIWRWTQHYGPEVLRRLQGEMKRKSSTWHMDETFVRIAGKQKYLFRAVDSHGQTVDFYLSETRDREAAKLFLQRAMTNPDNPPPGVFARAVCGAIRRRFESCRPRAACGSIVGNENAHTAITGSNPITAT
jgi:IS6 family transposase